jgi:p-aminobenzoyl-glutamate transporter AbgT
MTNQATRSKSFFNSFLNFTEKAGNALPHPATLFAIMALLVIILSGAYSIGRQLIRAPVKLLPPLI